MKFKRFIGAFAFVIAMLTFSSCSKSNEPLNFTLTYKDASNLGVGQFVVYRGIQIGEVTGVDLHNDNLVYVGVKIYPTYKKDVYKEAEFEIEKPGGILDLSGERQITMTDEGSTRTPIRDGDIVQGYNGFWDNLASKASSIGKAAVDWAGNLSQQVLKSIGDFAQSQQAKDLLASLQTFADSAKSLTEQQYDTFKANNLPKLEEQGKKLKDQLERSGQSERAKKFWDKFSSAVEQFKE